VADVNKLASPQYFFNGKRKRTSVLHNVTPLFDAADKGHTHVVMELIKAGADVNQANSEGATPLYHAAQKGHEGIVVALIQAGVQI
jgi:cytohesin